MFLGGLVAAVGPSGMVKRPATKQTFLGCPTNVCLDLFVFAEFFPKTGKAILGNSAYDVIQSVSACVTATGCSKVER